MFQNKLVHQSTVWGRDEHAATNLTLVLYRLDIRCRCSSSPLYSHTHSLSLSLSQEAYVFISAESKEDVTEEKIGAELSKVRSPTEHVRRISRSKDKETVVSGPLAIPSLSTRGGANTWTHPGTVPHIQILCFNLLS